MAGLGTTMLCGVLALTLVAPPRATLAPPLLDSAEAQRKLDAGLEEFYAEDFEAAAALFAEAYALEPQPFLLYSWAQAERYANNCPKAVELFERFLRAQPPEEEAQRARQKIVECGGIPPSAEELAAAEIPPAPEIDPPTNESREGDVPPPPPPALDDDAQPSPAPRPGRALMFAGLGVSLVGVVTAATGGILVAGGERIREEAPNMGDHQAFAQEQQRGADRKRTGIIVASVGGGVLLVGAALAITGAVLRKRRRPTAWQPTAHGLAIRF